MGVLQYVGDTLRNLVANLGTPRDKAAGSHYAAPCYSDEQLFNAYRGAWLPRKVVDVPALDACRKWRDWQAENDQITAIEAEEDRLGVQAKVLDALTKGRLFGGAAIYIGTGETDVLQPLKPESLAKSGLQHLTVLTRRQLKAGELETDPLSELYGRPKLYTLSGATGTVDIHPSRLVLFTGNGMPDPEMAGQSFGWGDSVLTSVFEAIRNADSTAANVASLVFEAKIDVINIPNLMQHMADPGHRSALLDRFALAATAKGINGTLILDTEEVYTQKSANFASLTDVLMAFVQLVAGAADIPVTRLLGQSPAGMNSTGESDLRNYYDRVQAMQELILSPAMRVLDDCLIRSALGSRPAEVHYVWSSLWQTTASERAEIGKKSADTIKALSETRLFADEALSAAAANMLIELGVMPGLEAAIEEFGARDFDAEADADNHQTTAVTDPAAEAAEQE